MSIVSPFREFLREWIFAFVRARYPAVCDEAEREVIRLVLMAIAIGSNFGIDPETPKPGTLNPLTLFHLLSHLASPLVARRTERCFWARERQGRRKLYELRLHFVVETATLVLASYLLATRGPAEAFQCWPVPAWQSYCILGMCGVAWFLEFLPAYVLHVMPRDDLLSLWHDGQVRY